MVTQRDIARELGVAVSTVSRSLSDVPGIPEATKERVRQAAERLGYRRDAHAASLRTAARGRSASSSEPSTIPSSLNWPTTWRRRRTAWGCC